MNIIPESHKDLLEAPVGVLATNGADGFPQVSAVWFLHDEDGLLRISLPTTRQKVKNMQRNPDVSLLIIDPANPYRTLEIRARSEISPDPDYEFANKLGKKYEADIHSFDPPGTTRVVATLHPVKANAYG